MLYYPINVNDIEYFIQNCPRAKQMSGLTIIVEGSRTGVATELLNNAIEQLKATGYFDNLKRDFKVCIYIDIPERTCEERNVEAVRTILPIFRYFEERTTSVRCFARVMSHDERLACEGEMELKEFKEQSLYEIMVELIESTNRVYLDKIIK
jgi:hypothetical protein